MSLTDTAAERAVISGCVHDSNAFLDVDYLLQPTSFTDETNQTLWHCIKSIRAENIDAVIDFTLIRSKAKELGLEHIVEDPNEISHIKRLIEFSVEPSNIRRFASIIRKLEVARLLHNQLEEAQSEILQIKGNESIDSIMALAENRIFDFTSLITNGSEEGLTHIKDGALEYFEYLLENERDIVGISSGYPLWDSYLGGFRRKAVSIVGARTGVGKCLGKNTPVQMYDGSVKYVQDIVVGDVLIGPDAQPRQVLSTTQGYGPLYEIKLVKGNSSYIVNEDHVLSLKRSAIKHADTYPPVNMSVKEYLKRSQAIFFRNTHRGWKSKIHFGGKKPKFKFSFKVKFDISYYGEGEYYGFQLDKDHLFLLEDGIVTHNSMLADNISLHVAGKLQIPILYLDTEMGKDGHWHRLWANLSDVPSKEIENGKFGRNEVKKNKVRSSIEYINNIPYHYVDISGKPFEETLSYVRRWLIKEVGYDENGKINDCLVIYDYLKMMSATGLSAEMKEFQILGFQMTGLHNFAVKFDIPILSFVQLNRDGIDKESTDTVSQSDRIVWLASNLSIYKPKSDDEMSASANEGNRKMVVVKNRYGSINNHNEYINMIFDGTVSRIKEGRLSSQVPVPLKKKQEFEVEDDGEPTDFKSNNKKMRSKTQYSNRTMY